MSFMIASTGIHLALVATSDLTNITLPGSTESVMAVKLEEEKHQHAEPTKKHIQQEIITKKSILKKKITTAEASNTTPETKTPVQSKTTLQANETRAHVASIIYKELKPFFKYPRLAVKRNWQGKVLLSLRVSSSGKIENIQVKQSSGYNILDQAAINSLRKMGKLPRVSSLLIQDIELKFPITYKLIEG